VTRRGELAETDTLGRPWGFEDNGATERPGEEEEEVAALKEKEKKKLGCFFFFFFSFFFFFCVF
jgi:hypothetical protein